MMWPFIQYILFPTVLSVSVYSVQAWERRSATFSHTWWGNALSINISRSELPSGLHM